LDCTPPIDTRVSAPCARASGTRYSSLRTLFPPNASPELQSSRLAQLCAPPSVRGQPLQRMHRARAEHQRIPREISQRHQTSLRRAHPEGACVMHADVVIGVCL
jgi:hypothetical protein